MTKILTQQDKSIKIETYWNVNIGIILAQSPETLIKIETYWNVNVCRRTHLTPGMD